MTEAARAAAAEAALIRAIALRALNSISGLRSQGVLRVDLQRAGGVRLGELPLRLQSLLAADGYSFAAEIIGIRRHLDRATGALTAGYLPRFHHRRAQRAA